MARIYIQGGAGYIDMDITSPSRNGLTQAADAPAISTCIIALADTVTKNIIVLDMTQVPDLSSAFTLQYAVECTDGVNTQIQSGILNANVAKAANGTYATNAIATGTANTVTSGGMTVTFAWVTSPNQCILTVNANSSLTPTQLNIKLTVRFATHPLAVSLAPGV